MDKRRVATIFWIALAVACFVMGFLSLTGVVSRTDTTGRLLFGIGWILIGVGWLGRYFLAKKKWQRESEEARGAGSERET